MTSFPWKYNGQLTVGALKLLIKDLPDDWTVNTEGCDCTGPSDGIEIDEGDKELLIKRNDLLERIEND